jgi:hypothetical protein
MTTECLQSGPLSQLANLAMTCLHQRIMTMTNRKLYRFPRADCDRQAQHQQRVDTASTVAGEGSHGASAGTLLDRSVADHSDNASRIDLMTGERSAAHDRKRPGRGGDPALATSSEITTTTEYCRKPHGAAIWYVFASSRVPLVESPRDVRYTNEGATPLPRWMRATRPSRAGMSIPGLLTALAVVAAINGILSTVLELAWL